MANGKGQMANGLGFRKWANCQLLEFCRLNPVYLRRSLENHVIPAKAGIHCVPDQKMDPRFRGVDEVCDFNSLGPVPRAEEQLKWQRV
jgi:hypothetical protein